MPRDWSYTIEPDTIDSLGLKQKAVAKGTLYVPPYAPAGNYTLFIRARAFDGTTAERTVIFVISPTVSVSAERVSASTILGIILAALVMVGIAYLVWRKRESLFGTSFAGTFAQKSEPRQPVEIKPRAPPAESKFVPLYGAKQLKTTKFAKPKTAAKTAAKPKPEIRKSPKAKLGKGKKYEEMLKRLRKIEKKLRE